jgi:UDPglucose 6-dehydrogenase
MSFYCGEREYIMQKYKSQLIIILLFSSILLTKTIYTKKKPTTRTSRIPCITIIGTGYVGLVTGACLAKCGNNVICADINKEKISLLKKGISPIYEKGLEDIINQSIKKKCISFTTNIPEAINHADVIFITVGTPMHNNGEADLSYVEDVVKTIANHINSYTVICTKSTVPIGTGAWIKKMLLSLNVDPSLFSVASNPEFLREGSAVSDFLEPDRIIFGTDSKEAIQILSSVYKNFTQRTIPIVKTNIATAESIKYASNAFLAVKLSFINEMANICDATGADIKTVAYAMGLDKRISPLFLRPGPGFGGSCFPKDSHALIKTAQKHNLLMEVVSAAKRANKYQKKIPALKLLRLMNNKLKGKTIAVLGLAFKAETDDIRYSPSIETIQTLINQGAHIKAYDPQAMKAMKNLFPNITYCTNSYQATTDADGLIIMTEWDEFKQLNLTELAKRMKQKIIIDARNILNTNELKRLKFVFDTIGGPSSS